MLVWVISVDELSILYGRSNFERYTQKNEFTFRNAYQKYFYN